MSTIPTLNVSDHIKNLGQREQVHQARDSMDWDKADFLKMMLMQLRHQDPLNPVANEDFVQQLSSLSSVEAQRNSLSVLEEIRDGFSKTIDELSQSSKTMNETAILSLLNKEVAILTDRLHHENRGDSHELRFSAGSKSHPLTVKIYDSTGNEVRTISIDSPPDNNGLYSFNWDGKDANGENVTAGIYQVKIFHNDTLVDKDAGVLKENKVEGIKFIDGNITVMIGGNPYPVDAIREIRGS